MPAMKRRAAIAAIIALASSAAALAQPPSVAIKGYDPVAYFTEARAVKGNPTISYDFDENRYYFSSTRHRDLFAADPERYAPQFAGLCAAGLADGRKVEPDPTAFVVQNGKLYLFEASRGVSRVKADPTLLDKAHQNHKRK